MRGDRGPWSSLVKVSLWGWFPEAAVVERVVVAEAEEVEEEGGL